MTTEPGLWQKIGRVIDETIADLRLRISEVFDVPILPFDPEPTTNAPKAADAPPPARCADCGGLLIPGGSGRRGPVCGDCGRPADARDRA